jgi:chorismate mutase
MNKKKLAVARKKIDKIDNQIFNLIKKRAKIVHVMMNIKTLKKQIIDNKRINKILIKIKKKSISNNVDVKITRKIWNSIIWSFIDYQKRNFKK